MYKNKQLYFENIEQFFFKFFIHPNPNPNPIDESR
jgi:hypothetical protein